ncbi:Acyl-CoA synthetase (AMP-forming)/AMP-acid ligase II [Lachnospiraceae bacterium NE2001]|nr:Acyl-CoA synthetase (AMP-forming)/AMP-acid ligase II [Lachnospiraceae bacterium NE2001]
MGTKETNIIKGILAKKQVDQNQKAWKFIQEVNSISVTDLNKTAIEDGSRKYTYGLMFREWERYASVFSALNMTAEKKARVGILGSTCAEVIFSYYGLNMVGADVSIIPTYSALTPKKVLQTIRNENLTDFIITDDFAQINLIYDLLTERSELGLNNVIILHVPITGVTVTPMLTAAQEAKYQYLKGQFKPVCMDELLTIYGNHPVSYADKTSGDTALILHTSGTTSGTGKPVALSDSAVNSAASIFYDMPELDLPWDNLVTAVIVDLSNAYGLIDQVHLPFAVGATVVVAPGGILNPWFYKAIPAHRITFLFTISAMFMRWMKMPERNQLDFSSLRFVILGGTSVSAADKKNFYSFIQEHNGKDITMLNGYGISELGGACCLSSSDLDDESIGYPLPGVNVRLYDDDKQEFLPVISDTKKGLREGVLYLNSPALATIKMDGEDLIKVEMVDNTPYVCTNDLVRIETDGRITFLGRASRYFINEGDRKFDAGRVEAEFAKQSGIEGCCIVPFYVKTTHDNIPMLCVKTEGDLEEGQNVIKSALRKIYIEDKTISPDNIPMRVKIAEDLPRNGNGKLDLYKIRRDEIEGSVFTIKPKTKKDKLIDYILEPYEDGPADMIKEVFDGLSAELKGSLPFKNKNDSINNKEEDYNMKNVKKPFEGFNAMNQMGKQMMSNMMNKMGQMNQAQNFSKASFGNMPNIIQKDQMLNYLFQMNLTALGLMQKTIDQNTKMMNQMIDMMTTMNKNALKPEEPAEEAMAEDAMAEEDATDFIEIETEEIPAKKTTARKTTAAKKTATTKKTTAAKKTTTERKTSAKKATTAKKTTVKKAPVKKASTKAAEAKEDTASTTTE